MKFSEKFDVVLKSISEVQVNAISPKKGSTAEVVMKTGGKYTFSYADLEHIMDAVKELIPANGLVMLQNTGIEAGGAYGLFTRIVHLQSSQWVESFMEIDRKCTAQEQGGEQTYFRRYAIQNMFGIVPVDPDALPKTKPEPPKVGAVRNHGAPATTASAGRTSVKPRVNGPAAAQAENGEFNNFNGGGVPFNGRRG